MSTWYQEKKREPKKGNPGAVFLGQMTCWWFGFQKRVLELQRKHVAETLLIVSLGCC